ncbi:class I SAM-dependent methyltransferase [Candidatus Dependentiae bacterium]|nr:MAG: class I SAM-dependent methyltransferase [Candidatus Dependentiae bacterium]
MKNALLFSFFPLWIFGPNCMYKDWDAQHYKLNSQLHYENAMNVINQLSFRGDEVVLDIGCGDGRITYDIAKRVPHGSMIGIDPSANMIEEAKKSFADVKNMSFEQIGAEDFTFDILFDLIVSFFALHYVSNHEKVLENIFTALKPNGTFIALMALRQPDIATYDYWSDIFAGQEKWNTKTEAEYKYMLEKAGFKNIIVKAEETSYFFATKKDLFNWIWGCAPYIAGFDQEKALQIATEIVDTIANGKEENIEMKGPNLYVKAEKT